MKFPFFKQANTLEMIGYKADQEGIMKRYLREKNNWQTHLKKSSDYIIRFCDELPAASKIAVLGSGWLLDLPVDYLLSRFKLVYFIDMIHPVQVKHKFRDATNLIFIEKDLTGYATEVLRIVNESAKSNIIESLAILTPEDVLSDLQYDAIVSVNILTQLDSLLCDFISSKKYFSEDQLLPFQIKLQQEHLKILSHSPSCLISDVQEIFTYRNNSEAFRTDTLKVNWPAGVHSDGWNWIFDSNYSYHPRYKTNLSVKAEMLF